MSAVDEVLGRISPEMKKQLEEFLMYAPRWLLESFASVTMEKGTVFMHEGEPVEKVYILLDGRVTASETRVESYRYDYMTFEPMEVFGAMEFLSDVDSVQTTLITAKKCLFLETAADRFERWMHEDIHALLIQTRKMTKYLLEQGRDTRLNLLLQGSDRICLYFVRQYEKYGQDGRCIMNRSLEEIANATGLSLRTVNRSLSDMIEADNVRREGRRLIINDRQYERMKKDLDHKVCHFSRG